MHFPIVISAALVVMNGVSALPSPIMTAELIPSTSTNTTSNVKIGCTADDDGLSSWYGLNIEKAIRSTRCADDPADDEHKGKDGLAGLDGVSIERRAAKSMYKPDDILPVQDLPPCYEKCTEKYRYAMPYAVPDVRQMTVDEFCVTKRRAVHTWFEEAVVWCIKDNCVPTCFPQCRDESNDWSMKVCGFTDQQG